VIIPTEEQSDIIYSEAELIFVLAGAGTGKTSTLVSFSNMRKKNSILYIVYNNSVKEEAKGKFPERVIIHTIHSLAFSIIGKKYKEKLTENLQVENIVKALSFFEDKRTSDSALINIAMSVINALNYYFNSDVLKIGDLSLDDTIKNLAEEYWLKMQDIENQEALITHDGYLKLYQLTNPKLDYDYIMVDEAQDSNEVMLDIVFKQHSKKIFVGDPSQKIYGFRGAINVFNSKKYMEYKPEMFSLTESFRFGQEIADVANEVLNAIPGNKIAIKGCDRESEIAKVDKEIQYTILFRTNTKLVDKAISLAEEGKSIHIIGGLEDIIKDAMDIYYLFAEEYDNIKSAFFKNFKHYNNFLQLTADLKIAKYKFLVRLIEQYGDTLLIKITKLKEQQEGKRSADVLLSSTHKAKGLEFVSVILWDDFKEILDFLKIQNPDEKIIEEINLLYVAITRATHTLELNKNVENFRRVV